MAVLQPAAWASEDADDFLDALADGDRAPIAAGDIAVIVAHPDDETIGAGAQLTRFVGANVIVVTNGAPRSIAEAQAHGCSSTETYAELRSDELCRAMALAHVPQHNIIELGLTDQSAARHLAALTRSIYYLLTAQGTRIVLTHAYEGGHPDNDATAFAVAAAAALRRRQGHPIGILEMPFYRADGSQQVVQRFPPWPCMPITTIRLNDGERALKRAMLTTYRSQHNAQTSFAMDAEYFRPAPRHDFLALPNNGWLLYERRDWGMTGEQWLASVRAAQFELGLGDSPWT